MTRLSRPALSRPTRVAALLVAALAATIGAGNIIGVAGAVAAGVASLAPFGAGNPRPVFAARGVEASLEKIARAHRSAGKNASPTITTGTPLSAIFRRMR